MTCQAVNVDTLCLLSEDWEIFPWHTIWYEISDIYYFRIIGKGRLVGVSINGRNYLFDSEPFYGEPFSVFPNDLLKITIHT